MTEIVTPTNIIDEVMNSLNRLYRRPFKFFANRWQQWSFVSVIGLFGLMSLGALLFAVSPWPEPQWYGWAYPTLFLALMAYGAGAVHIVMSMVGSLRLLLSPERLALDPIKAAFQGELDLIARVDRIYGPREVAYALDRLTLDASQFRARISLLIGALDKVGVIPLAVGAYFPLRAFFREQPPAPSELNWMVGAAVGLVAIYIISLAHLRWVQCLDDACLVLKHALQAKPSIAPPPTSAPPPPPVAVAITQNADGGSRRQRPHRAK